MKREKTAIAVRWYRMIMLCVLLFGASSNISLNIILLPSSTIHYPLSTIHHPLSTLHHPLSTLHHPLSTIHYPLSTIHYPLSTIHHPLSLNAQNVQKGIASFYSKRATGARTASGERLHHDSLTCAHKTYPFGTLLKVTNPANDRVVVVRVTDRGPYRRSRIIDLSWGAAKQLGILTQGIASVIVERIGYVTIPWKDTTHIKLPELELATPGVRLSLIPDWQDSLVIDHRNVRKKIEQTAWESWVENFKDYFRRR